jgi:hypothetical protein
MTIERNDQEFTALLKRFDEEIERFFRAARRGQRLLLEIRSEIAKRETREVSPIGKKESNDDTH